MSQQQQKAAPAAKETTEFNKLMAGPVMTGRHAAITESTSSFLGVHPTKVFDVLRGVWTVTKGEKPLTNDEVFLGMALISRYELDPFAREIYVTRDKRGKLMIIIGIDGWIRILNRTPGYDGFVQDIVMGDGDQIKEVITKIYSKDRSHPATYRAFATDYAQLGGFMLAKIPGHMLRLFSLRHAARLFTPLGCVVTEEEAKWMATPEPEPATSLDDLTEQMAAPARPPMTPEEVAIAACAILNTDPPTPEEVAADTAMATAEIAADKAANQDRICEEFRELFREADSASDVSRWSSDIVALVAAGTLTEDQAGELYVFANAAKDRLSKVM